MTSNYNKYPATKVEGYHVFCGYEAILDQLKKERKEGKQVYTCDTYPGVFDEEIILELRKLEPSLFIDMKEIFKSEERISEQLKYHLTDDRVFGRMYYGEVMDFIDTDKLEEAKNR